MASGSLARRYARALFSIGVDKGNYEKLGREVGDLANAVKGSKELAETLSNPVFPRSDREKVLRAIMARLGASTVTINFTMLLLDRERLAVLPDISRELDALIDDKAGRVKATVTSATVLTLGQEKSIVTALEKLSGKKVQLEKTQDPALLGGVVAKVGDVVYDGSLRTQLEHLRHQLTQ